MGLAPGPLARSVGLLALGPMCTELALATDRLEVVSSMGLKLRGFGRIGLVLVLLGASIGFGSPMGRCRGCGARGQAVVSGKWEWASGQTR